MAREPNRRAIYGVLYCMLLFLHFPVHARSTEITTLPSPVRFEEIPRLASERRAEIRAAQERTSALKNRESVVSGLEDPMILPSIDHWPFGMPEADISLSVEQRFPLSGIRGQKRKGAQAQTRMSQSETEQITLDIQADAADAFLMLYKSRSMREILKEQKRMVEQIISAVNARYKSGSANTTQADVIRAEVELSRVDIRLKSLRSEISSAEAMFNASLGRPVDMIVPGLSYDANRLAIYEKKPTVKNALEKRPEITRAQAQLQYALSEVSVMRSMYLPMITARAGYARTMEEGPGLMFMLGISLPVWLKKLRAGVAEAQAMERMARSELEAMKLMVEGEAESAYYRFEADKTRYVLLRDDVLARVRQSIDPSLAGYSAGLIPLVSVIETINMLLMTREDLLEAEISVGSSWIILRRAAGTIDGVSNE